MFAEFSEPTESVAASFASWIAEGSVMEVEAPVLSKGSFAAAVKEAQRLGKPLLVVIVPVEIEER